MYQFWENIDHSTIYTHIRLCGESARIGLATFPSIAFPSIFPDEVGCKGDAL